ncbi:jg19124 [Pararge aegeria aegeria]|uniref:Jg19124 protein n=1 Tax=Pararge aegeria aegeria TaxID=348720 RepID=A0A8S4QT46_9NEOP|nr:jg19124 [Pararge aegeria aegeria]
MMFDSVQQDVPLTTTKRSSEIKRSRWRASNDLSQVPLDIFVMVHLAWGIRDPPEITIRPRNLQVRANGIAAFYCAARGDPIPNIQWRKNGKRVSSMQSRYQVSGMESAAGLNANGAVLRIEPVRAQRDDATYECVAENGVGDAVTAVATLTVFEGPGLQPVELLSGSRYHRGLLLVVNSRYTVAGNLNGTELEWVGFLGF